MIFVDGENALHLINGLSILNNYFALIPISKSKYKYTELAIALNLKLKVGKVNRMF